MIRFLYNLLFPLAFVLYLPFFIGKLVRRGGSREGFGERFGIFSRARRQALGALRRPVWIHAVSVGEAVAACSFIRAWQARMPDCDIVLSTTTTTGHEIAAKKLPEGVSLIYCPLDFHFFVKATLDLLRPSMLVIFEVEIWPNLVTLAANRRMPVALVNGRMSDQSAAGYAKHRWIFGDLFRRFTLFCMQTPDDVARVRRVVGDAVPVLACNTMKFDQIPDTVGTDQGALLARAFGPGEHRLWCAASTHPGEEALVLDAFRDLQTEFPELRLILVPRHHERAAEVERALTDRAISYQRLVNPTSLSPADVLLVNTTGELMNLLAVSDLVFVGKSLAGNEGGHNIIEPAIFGKAIIHGPHMENFRRVAHLFKAADAVREVARDQDLRDAVADLLGDEAARAELGRRARAVVDQQRGAIDKTLDQLLALDSDNGD